MSAYPVRRWGHLPLWAWLMLAALSAVLFVLVITPIAVTREFLMPRLW